MSNMTGMRLRGSVRKDSYRTGGIYGQGTGGFIRQG